MKKVLLAFAVLIIVAWGLYFFRNYWKDTGSQLISNKNSTVTINNNIFKVAVVISEKDMEIGLSETKSIAPNQGMIFLFKTPGYYSFWMKNMKFPIDIIYINGDAIVTIINNAQSPKNNAENLTIYSPAQPADKVLEIQAGLSDKYHFKNGDKVKYENLGN
jgi:uncharacterized protein